MDIHTIQSICYPHNKSYLAKMGVVEVEQRKGEINSNGLQTVTLLADGCDTVGDSRKGLATKDDGCTLLGEVAKLVVAPDNEC